MYPLAVVGDNLTARAAITACHKAGFHDISWHQASAPANQPEDQSDAEPKVPHEAVTLPANITRVISALDGGDALHELGHQPDRAQVRMASSGFLISELPLGEFSSDRYGAPHVNIEACHWAQLLPVKPHLQPAAPLAELEAACGAVVVCAAQMSSSSVHATHQLWHTCTPVEPDTSRANITWLGKQQCAWQFSTVEQTHTIFCTRTDRELEAQDWHAGLSDTATQAQPTVSFNAYDSDVNEHWHSGSAAYLGPAAYTPNPFLREASALGVEDAWVLSRMLENYEEDVHDGLSEYEKYRRGRARRIARAAALTATQQNSSHPLKRGLHHLNVALSTRFLPEIAMQRIDWFYSYDCIRGFR